MTIILTTVEGNLAGQDGQALVNTDVWFELSHAGVAGEANTVIIPNPISATTDDNGKFSINLWANVGDIGNTFYKVFYKKNGFSVHLNDVQVPNSGPANFSDLQLKGIVRNLSPEAAVTAASVSAINAADRAKSEADRAADQATTYNEEAVEGPS